jgi:uncharacterized surface protein with fasciclin (FAS1) repeats
MANNKFNKYIGAIALGVAIMAVPSCSDDHFDPNYGGDSKQSVDATKTLWELISENPNLRKFKTIAEKTKFWKDDTHPIKDYTYANILNSGQVATVWAPEDDAISDLDFQKWLSMCESNGTDGYNVQQQFIGNHIALWRNNISDTNKDTIKMINGKNLIFDKTDSTNCTIQDVAINKKNIAAMNGTLHTIKGTTPFLYNFYEYLKFSPSLPLLSQYVVSKDTTEFYKDASIEGLPDKDGNPSYVDSVYRTRNILFESFMYLPNSSPEKWDMCLECFGERINAEDSAFIMVMPTDEAWQKAKEKIKHLYKYPSIYEDKYESEAGENAQTIFRTIADPDSLTNMSINMDLTTPLVFNIHKQPKTTSKLWELDEFVANKGATARYLLNTFGDTLRSTDTWDKTSIFNGNLVKMSNGYGYEATEWAFPRELYNPDLEVEISGSFYMMQNTSTYYKVGSGSRTIPFNNEKYSYIANKYGKVSRNNFYYLDPPGATANPHVEIRLAGNLPSTSDIVVRGQAAQVMSGKYDIMVVMVPYWYRMISDAEAISDDFYDQHYIDSIAALTQMSFTAKVRYCTNASNGKDTQSKQSSVVKYDGSKVDTLMVFEDFEFPYSYKNLRYSYPTLILDGATKSSGDTSSKKGFIYGMYIDRVILKSKETGVETILDPR